MKLRSQGGVRDAEIPEMTSSTAAAGSSSGEEASRLKRKPIPKKDTALLERLIIKAAARARAKEEYRAKKKARMDVNPMGGSASEQFNGNQNAEQATSQANNPNPAVANAQSKRKENSPPHEAEVFDAALLPARLFCTDRYPTGGRINSYSRSEYLFELIDALDGPEFAWIKASCFGPLFRLPFRKCCLSGKLVHQFLCRSLVTQKKEEMWFVFGGHPLRFSLREFGIVTGLNCAPYPCAETLYNMENPPDDDEEQVDEERIEEMENPAAAAAALEKKKKRYYQTLIGPNQTYSIQNIVDMLKVDLKKPEEERMGFERRLRLALVVIVDGILVCKTSDKHATYDTAYMAKNLVTFVKYPWGRLSFQRTLEMVTAAGQKVESVEKLVEKLCQSHTANHGFTLAFQLVILKAIPAFDKFLPRISDEVTISDPAVPQLTMLKTFHNSNLLQTELSPNLVVEAIIDGDEGDMQDYAWGEQATEDVAVDYMLRWIKAGHKFRKEDWHGGDAHCELITSGLNTDVKAKKVVSKGKGEGKPKRKATAKGRGEGESSRMSVDSMSAEDILREVDRRINEHTLQIQQMLSRVTESMDAMKEEFKRCLKDKGVFDNKKHTDFFNQMNKSSSCSLGGGSNQGGEKGKGKIHIVISDDEDGSQSRKESDAED